MIFLNQFVSQYILKFNSKVTLSAVLHELYWIMPFNLEFIIYIWTIIIWSQIYGSYSKLFSLSLSLSLKHTKFGIRQDIRHYWHQKGQMYIVSVNPILLLLWLFIFLYVKKQLVSGCSRFVWYISKSVCFLEDMFPKNLLGLLIIFNNIFNEKYWCLANTK